MKNWKLVLLVAGILLLMASFGVYAVRIASCYQAMPLQVQSTPAYNSFREGCLLDSPITTQFKTFLLLFIPGIILFSSYWLLTRPAGKSRHTGQVSVFLLVLIFDSLLVTLYSLLEYPAPGSAGVQSAWVLVVIAALGFLCYLAALALWHWKLWGLLLFQGASFTLATFILLSGGSLFLAGVIIAGVIGLSLLLRPLRNKLGS
jgi:hypothetical protein